MKSYLSDGKREIYQNKLLVGLNETGESEGAGKVFAFKMTTRFRRELDFNLSLDNPSFQVENQTNFN